jgi:peptidoglycan hydrolase CwlO-like protein
MYKKILLTILFIPSLILANTLPEEKLKEIKDLTAQATNIKREIVKAKHNLRNINEKIEELKGTQKEDDSGYEKFKFYLITTVVVTSVFFLVRFVMTHEATGRITYE